MRKNVHLMYFYSPKDGKVHYFIGKFKFVLSKRDLIHHLLFRNPSFANNESFCPDNMSYSDLADVLMRFLKYTVCE